MWQYVTSKCLGDPTPVALLVVVPLLAFLLGWLSLFFMTLLRCFQVLLLSGLSTEISILHTALAEAHCLASKAFFWWRLLLPFNSYILRAYRISSTWIIPSILPAKAVARSFCIMALEASWVPGRLNIVNTRGAVWEHSALELFTHNGVLCGSWFALNHISYCPDPKYYTWLLFNAILSSHKPFLCSVFAGTFFLAKPKTF